MTISEFERLLEAAMPKSGRTGITLTDPPDDQIALCDLVDRALAVGERRAAPLAEVHLPFSRFSVFCSSKSDLPLTDTGIDGVVRFIFEARAAA
jgi:hypothetical protein